MDENTRTGKSNVVIGAIGHVDHDKITLTESIEKYLSKHASVEDVSQGRDSIDISEIVRRATLMSLLLSDTDEITDKNRYSLLGRKVETKSYTMLPKNKYPRRK